MWTRTWDEEIIFKGKKNRRPELPEDIYILMLRKNAKLEKLVDRMDLDLEL